MKDKGSIRFFIYYLAGVALFFLRYRLLAEIEASLHSFASLPVVNHMQAAGIVKLLFYVGFIFLCTAMYKSVPFHPVAEGIILVLPGLFLAVTSTIPLWNIPWPFVNAEICLPVGMSMLFLYGCRLKRYSKNPT